MEIVVVVDIVVGSVEVTVVVVIGSVEVVAAAKVVVGSV
jgi:hypothetical protein